MPNRATAPRTAATLAVLLSACAPSGGESDARASATTPGTQEEVSYAFLRNATARLTYGGQTFLLDPMLSEVGALPSFAGIAPNPTIALPVSPQEAVAGIDAVIVGHMHLDHFDPAAAEALPKDIPVFTPDASAPVFPADPENPIQSFEAQLSRQGFVDVTAISDGASVGAVTMTEVFAEHGRDTLGQAMGEVRGILLEAEGQPTIYWTGDTILDEGGRVEAVLAEHAPDIVIAHTGGAVLEAISPDPLMMDEAQAITFFAAAKAANPAVQIVAVHMNALDHARTTRASLGEAVTASGADLPARIVLPKEGETVTFN